MRMSKLLTFYFSEKEVRKMVSNHLKDDLDRSDWASHLEKNEYSLEVNKSGELVVSIDGEFEEKGIQKLKDVVEDFVPKRVKDTLDDAGKLAGDIRNVAKTAVFQKGKRKRVT